MTHAFTSDDPVIIASRALSLARKISSAAKPGSSVDLPPEVRDRLAQLFRQVDARGLFSEAMLD